MEMQPKKCRWAPFTGSTRSGAGIASGGGGGVKTSDTLNRVLHEFVKL